MLANEFFVAVRRTAKADHIAPELEKFHWCLGLAGEVGEIARAHALADDEAVLDECGDLLWYLANYCHAYNLSFADCYTKGIAMECDNIVMGVSMLLEDTKKREFYQHKVIPDAELEHDVCWILSSVQMLLGMYHYELATAMHHNTDKLNKRYPEGFNG